VSSDSSSPSSPPIRLADYRPPAWRIDQVELLFELDPAATEVQSTLHLRPDPEQPGAPLRLDGEALELLSIAVDGTTLDAEQYSLDATGLTVHGVADACVLQTRVRIHPDRNTRLEGLYASGSMLLTQCEAEGFRRITFFADRPDVLARYTVELRAERARYPVLLSNGNPAGTGDLGDGRHYARWIDPHPKPSYLFALVAGRIECVEAPFTTIEGRQVSVCIWADPRDTARCQHALDSTLRAMRWDEERFGRAYDLDVYNIVAAQDFTMGAMENKGLNIFNARYILADPDSATDADYEGIESVIGHEYFHNWSGNRVTCRDWFQLSLKEGFTVFRDQEFTADLHSRPLKRIDDVRMLKSRQFAEDSGPLAHPVRTGEYTEINNFYTATVYEKGAEIVRMLHTLLGEDSFRRGCDLYFERNDGRAATVEDFLAAMHEASGRDLEQFKHWYAQAGTPELRIRDRFDAASGQYLIEIEQHTPPTPGQSSKQPLHLPLAYALYDRAGQAITQAPETDADTRPGLVELRKQRHTLRFKGLDEAPLPAFLQSLSAPARLDYPYSAEQLARLVAVEPDALVRFEAIQRLAFDALLGRGPDPAAARAALIDALGGLLVKPGEDPAFVAECHAIADVWTLADQCERIDLDELVRQRDDLLDELAEVHADAYADRYALLAAVEPGALTPRAISARRLKSVCLARLTRMDPEARHAAAQFGAALCMTDRLAALTQLVHFDAPTASDALGEFRRRWADDPLVSDKWIGIVATRPQPEAVDDVLALLAEPLWQPKNPNRVRALLGSFARGNPVAAHRRDGAGYALLFGEIARLDAINPQVAARLLTAFEPWKRLDEERRGQIEQGLRQLQQQAQSRDSADLLARMLA
jgi:aminopeptidase N